jgi:hypothetical protein
VLAPGLLLFLNKTPPNSLPSRKPPDPAEREKTGSGGGATVQKPCEASDLAEDEDGVEDGHPGGPPERQVAQSEPEDVDEGAAQEGDEQAIPHYGYA